MSDEVKVQFKSIKRKNLRQRKHSSEEEEGTKAEDEKELQSKLELIHETKEKQKLRQREKGVNV